MCRRSAAPATLPPTAPSTYTNSMTDPIWSRHYVHPVPWATTHAPVTLPAMFFASAERRAEAALFTFQGARQSYNQAADAVRRFASGLIAMGVEPGDRVGLYLPNVPHYIAAYYGAMAAGAIAVNFSPLYTVDELAHQVEDSGTRVLVTLSASALLPNALQVLERSSLERLVVGSVAEVLPRVTGAAYRLLKRRDIAAVPDDARITRWSDLLANDGAAALPPLDTADVALLQYTGGTTGTPKGAMLTHANLHANAAQVNDVDPQRGDGDADRILGVLPFFHVFANTCVLNRTVLNGGSIAMLPRFEAGAALKALADSRATALPGVPTMYQALLDHPACATTDFSSLRVCISGGAPLSAALHDRWEAVTGARLVEGYGLTESSGVVSTNPYKGENRLGTIGQPLPATRIRLLDQDDPSKEADERGEIALKGPQIMAGYWGRADADAEVFVDGWLRTGDVGTIDDDGFVRVVDRIKDMIAVGGFKVFPSQIEAVLSGHPAVRECLVLGLPDDYSGERPRAYAVVQPEGHGGTADELKAWLNGRLGKHERVDRVVLRDALPKTPIGKPSRKDLRAEVMGADAADG